MFPIIAIACSTQPQQVCLPVQTHDGSGQVRFEGDAGTLVVALETGAGTLKVFESGAPWWPDHWSGKTRGYRLWGGEIKQLTKTRTEHFQEGSSTLRLTGWREQHAPIHQLESAWGGSVDAWGGLEFFFSLGDRVWFDGEQLCADRRNVCHNPRTRRPEVHVQVGGDSKTLLVDSAMRWSRVWGYGTEPLVAEAAHGVRFNAWPFPESQGIDRYGTGRLGGQVFDGVMGWQTLASTQWSWDLCSGVFRLWGGPTDAQDSELTPLELHRYNGHRQAAPYTGDGL